MADTVQYLLEECIPDLEDFLRRGLFTRAEIRRIIAARRDHEYALKRRSPAKEDFLRAIQYEESLEKLRRHRKRVQNVAAIAQAEAEADAAGPPRGGSRPKPAAAPSGVSDHSILRRIHFLHTRALRKFRGDLRLWSRLFAFCRSHGSSKSLSASLAACLALHPREAGVWAAAAAWESRCGDAVAARALMQRGLRSLPSHAGLWGDYVSLELGFAATLRARSTALGLPMAGGDDNDGADPSHEVPSGPTAAAAPSSGRAALLGGATALAAFRAGCSALPADAGFRLRVATDVATRHPWAAGLAAAAEASLETSGVRLHPDVVSRRAAASADPDAAWREAVDESVAAAASSDAPGAPAEAIAAAASLVEAYAEWIEAHSSSSDADAASSRGGRLARLASSVVGASAPRRLAAAAGPALVARACAALCDEGRLADAAAVAEEAVRPGGALCRDARAWGAAASAAARAAARAAADAARAASAHEWRRGGLSATADEAAAATAAAAAAATAAAAARAVLCRAIASVPPRDTSALHSMASRMDACLPPSDPSRQDDGEAGARDAAAADDDAAAPPPPHHADPASLLPRCISSGGAAAAALGRVAAARVRCAAACGGIAAARRLAAALRALPGGASPEVDVTLARLEAAAAAGAAGAAGGCGGAAGYATSSADAAVRSHPGSAPAWAALAAAERAGGPSRVGAVLWRASKAGLGGAELAEAGAAPLGGAPQGDDWAWSDDEGEAE